MVHRPTTVTSAGKLTIMGKCNTVVFISFCSLGFIFLLIITDRTEVVTYGNGTVKPHSKETNGKQENLNYINSVSSMTVPYKLFEKSYVYDSVGPTKELLYPEQKSFIRKAVTLAAHKTGLKAAKFEFGNYRLLSKGLEFQLFFKVNATSSRKVTLVQQFAKQPFLNEVSFSNLNDVNIIIPIQGKLEVLRLFLGNLVNNVLPTDPHLILTIVYFEDEKAEEAKSLLEQYLKASPTFRWYFVLVNDSQFSRGKGLKAGVEFAAKLNLDLVFFCDIDIFIKPQFFKRCRGNTIQHHQVYFPIVFSLYNPKIVYSMKQDKVPFIEDQLSVDTNHGFWRHFGYGMACIFRSDFEAAGGMPEFRTWGGEDEHLFNNIVSLGSIKPIRSPETGLFHIYHYKNCNDLSGTTYYSCIRTKAANEGNQMQLGLLLIKLEEGVDIEGALYSWKMVYKDVIISSFAVIALCILVIIYQCLSLKRRTNKKKCKKKSMSSS